MEEIKTLCNDVSHAVARAIRGLVGTTEGDRIVGMGADGTPTRMIDAAAEDAALEILASSGIDMKIVTEERGHITYGERPEFTLVLDPLDGTYNATHNIPFYSVSIAIGTADLSDIRYGKVFNLVNRMDFSATLGKGALCNGKEIHVASMSRLEECSISSYGYLDGEEAFKRLARRVRRIRSMGSAALELCFVASGRLDAFVDVRDRLRVMDVAAGVLIIQEAGGIVTDGAGARPSCELDVKKRVNIVASNATIHPALEKTIGL